MIESILSKLKTIEKIFQKPNAYQIVAMSATMSGLQTLKGWLGETAVYECQHRPVPLTEYTIDRNTNTLYEEPPCNYFEKQNDLKQVKINCGRKSKS